MKAADIKVRQIFAEMFPRRESSDTAGNFSATFRAKDDSEILSLLCNKVINVTINATFDAMLLQKKAKVLEMLQCSLQTPNLRVLADRDPIPI